MKRRSRAGGKPAEPRRRKTVTLKRRNAPKAVRRGDSSAVGQQTEVARAIQERANTDIGGWLRSLGLEQYEAAFRDNAINDRNLPSLTAEDLKDLGVSIVGHRRTLLDAIAALRADASAKAPSTDAVSAPSVSPEDRAERRRVTVMFSDPVGSTALSARMDPEDLREVISAYQKCVAETVRRSGGFVAKYMGDGVLTYYGYPQAHEDDAETRGASGFGGDSSSVCA